MVARLVWDQDVAGSNPVIPTSGKLPPPNHRGRAAVILAIYHDGEVRILTVSLDKKAARFSLSLFCLDSSLRCMLLAVQMSSVAGLSISSPFSEKREPWHVQSQLCSARLYLRAQPRCGHRGTVGVISPRIDSKALIKSCG